MSTVKTVNFTRTLSQLNLPRLHEDQRTIKLGDARLIEEAWLVAAVVECGHAAIMHSTPPVFRIRLKAKGSFKTVVLDPLDILDRLNAIRPTRIKISGEALNFPSAQAIYQFLRPTFRANRELARIDDLSKQMEAAVALSTDSEERNAAVELARAIAIVSLIDIDIGNALGSFPLLKVPGNLERAMKLIASGAEIKGDIDQEVKLGVAELARNHAAPAMKAYQNVRNRASQAVTAVGPANFFGPISNTISVEAIGLEFFPPGFFDAAPPSHLKSKSKDTVNPTADAASAVPAPEPNAAAVSEPPLEAVEVVLEPVVEEAMIELGQPLDLASFDPNGPWFPVFQMYERLGCTASFCTTGVLWEKVYAAFLLPASSGRLIACFDTVTPDNALYVFDAVGYLETVSSGGKAHVRNGIGKNAYLTKLRHTESLETRLRAFLSER